ARAATPPEPPRGSPQPAPDPADIREEANRVFVGNLPREATKSGLYRLFTEYGDVAEIHISMANGESKGYAFVEFITSDAATTVLNTKTIVYDKWLLNIRPARARQ
ncbi:MAG TPA: RNA-binding protein, partial [Urbifossiella sp.]|nr:RNA-binding protein [Urbifossiella sp.]